jgi:hypothetical protein
MIDQLQFQPLETLALFSPLGIRFWDEVTRQMIGDGLNVVAYPSGYPARRVRGLVNRHSVYVFRGLPGLQAVEHGGLETRQKSFMVEVTDSSSRFQPFLLSVELPMSGLYQWTCDPLSSPYSSDSPLTMYPTFVPLFSGAARQPSWGMAVVRAELWNALTQAPAAFAVMELYNEEKLLARGFADATGRVALIFPYPEPVSSYAELGTSPSSSGTAGNQSGGALPPWRMLVYVNYTPSLFSGVSTSPLPDICHVLSQFPATLLDGGQQVQSMHIQLTFGQDYIVRSILIGDTSIPPAKLLVIPAAQ